MFYNLDDIEKGWRGFTPEAVETLVLPNRIGVYILAYKDINDTPAALLLGHSYENDLRGVLRQRLYEFEAEYPYKRPDWFKIEYAPAKGFAFDRHCRLYHAYNALIPETRRHHPPAPTGTDYECPEKDRLGCDYRGGSA